MNGPSSAGNMLRKLEEMFSNDQKKDVNEYRDKRISILQSDATTSPISSKDFIPVVIEVGLNEAWLQEFHPDFVVMSDMQYKEVFGVTSGVALGPEAGEHTAYGGSRPLAIQTDNGTVRLQAVQSSNIERMFLMDTEMLPDSLSTVDSI